MTAAILYFFFLPETGDKTLKEIAEVFGDKMATNHIGHIDLDAKVDSTEQIESVETTFVKKQSV
ncbi:hypothetical protein H2198_008660 [Neophaeococcomyces mojaviensis]|uniref:Uncharacterized protein n=1 Tax=Neophaeococcomyces mojaviensis TaxID=3383035 RepID=A0ACC2ZWT8_9EURO|nr:hypothetical protein H2198_008660 [Knufia sp. JES_112]